MLKTKLNKPNSTNKLIFRKELIDMLESGKEKKLTLISAPAGYGKSTLISQWIDHCNLSYSWYSLDKSDNDIVTFLRYTIASIQSKYKNLCVKAEKLLESNSNSSFESVATYLINDLFEIKENFYLFFDDYHLIENNKINKLLSFLLDNLPDNIQIVLITRSDPSIPLARLRSLQQFTELRLSDLCFNANNIYDFFKKCLNINLTIEDAKNLESKTEGWVAGLQLTGLSLQGRDDVSDFVEKLKGDNRYIMDYLIEEVLQQQSQELRDFLLDTSILKRFNASLCNSLLDINNCQDIIEGLEKNNMFIIPLDNERNWFRYHHLFTSLLQKRWISQSGDRLTELHLRASEWFENKNYIIDSIEHALLSNDMDKAIQLLNKNVESIWIKGQHAAIIGFGNKLPDEIIVSNPIFSTFYSWMLITSGKIKEAEKYLLETEKNLIRYKEAENYKDIKGRFALTNALLFSLLGKKELVIQYAKQSINNLSDKNPLWNGWAYVSLGDAYHMNANLSESKKFYTLAIDNAKLAENQYLEITARFKLALCLARHGKFKSVFRICEKQLAFFKSKPQENLIYENYLAGFYSMYGAIQFVWNKCEEGLRNAMIGFELSKKLNDLNTKIFCSTGLISHYFSLGDLDKAYKFIEDFENEHGSNHSKPWLTLHLQAWKAELLMHQDEFEKAFEILEKYLKKKDEAINKRADILYVRLAKLYIKKYESEKAIQLLNELENMAVENDSNYMIFYAKILKVQAYLISDNRLEAKEILIKAIQLAQEEKYIRPFIDQRDSIYNLLMDVSQELKTHSNNTLNSIDRKFFANLMSSIDLENNRLKTQNESDLSKRELETLKLMAENLTNQEIAEKLFLSIHTIKSHVKSILLKLGVDKRSKAVVKAKELNII